MASKPVVMFDGLRIVEGIGGVWHYHLTDSDGYPSRSLCRRNTMASNAPLSSWGYKPTHMPTSYCGECAKLGGVSELRDCEVSK